MLQPFRKINNQIQLLFEIIARSNTTGELIKSRPAISVDEFSAN
jgi:hypothetical protein